jgi:GT2 family glycosyltransferase
LRQPRFKPHWNHTYYLAYDYIGPAVAFRRDLLERYAERAIDTAGTWRTELLLAAARSDTTAIRHIPRILTHHPIGNDQQAAGALARRAFHVQSHLNALRDTAAVTATPFGHLRLTRVLPTPAPKVSVIVPTRDRLDLLRPCIEGLRSRTDYPDFEILIADNGSTDTATRAYLVALGSDARVRIIDAHGPFNFSAINNRAVEAARGAVLCFLNNDIEVRGSGWLAELVAWASLPSVGAVGAKLLYATGTIQHAGIVVGLGGLAGHPHRFFPADHPGYMGRLVVPQEVSAVTAACLAVRREAFRSVGGFDAEAFPVAFNDVDLCLRLAARGLVNIWTPEAVLTHRETASRPRDFSRRRRAAWLAEAQALRERWDSVIANDPCYSPSLTREREDMTPG